ncbi:lactate utilization protein C [Alphaproteobacteria bacterium LSUCC0684]
MGAADRSRIFDRLRAANAGRVRTPHPGKATPPRMGQLTGKKKTDRFVDQARQQFATVDMLPSLADLPGYMSAWLRQHNLPQDIVIAPILEHLDWTTEDALSARAGTATTSDMVGVSLAFGAAAETGTVMMISGNDTPTTLNFVPDVEVIILSKMDISAGMEGCWEQLRSYKEDKGKMPRAVNYITGPSRTADVEATMVLGAHGPRRLHILLIDEASPWRKSR